MNDTHHSPRRNLWKTPQGIAGAILLAAGLLVMGPQIWACVCECYYSTDCSDGEYCDRGGCDQTTVNNKLRKGLCKKDKSVTPVDQAAAATALYSWIEAYAQAGTKGGGEPEGAWIAQAQAQPLSKAQQDEVREVAVAVVRLALGSTEYPDEFHANGGLFSSPQIVGDINQPCDTLERLDYGVVGPLDDVHLGALKIVQNAVVGELYQPGSGILEGELERLPAEQPAYATFGVCEFPHIMTGTYRFRDGYHCLESELRAMVHSLLSQAPIKELGGGSLRTLSR